MKMRSRKIMMRSGAVVLGLGLFVLGLFIGARQVPAIDRVVGVSNGRSPETLGEQVDFEPFWKVWNLIQEKYVAPDETAYQDRVWGAIKGLTRSLNDPYSEFLSPDEINTFEENINGVFAGVGMEIGMRDDALTVIAPLKGTPADRAGIQQGDVIIAIDDMSALDLSVDEAVRRIRGEEGTEVKLTILRDGEEELLEIPIVRALIEVPTMQTELRDDGIFVISFFSFDATAVFDFRQALREFAQTGSDKLILDMRGNPGGFLDAAVDIGSFFVPAGNVIVREAFTDGHDETVYRSRGYNVFNDSLKMVVLVDQGSASAAEILAGALQEYDIATLVGQQTFGKGSVQELIDVTSDTALKLTVARWLTPQGRSISKGGLTPDIVVPLTTDDLKAGRDPQLEKAVSVLQGEE